MQRFTEVLNDFFSLWVLTDIEALTAFQRQNGLSENLMDAFTRGPSVDQALRAGVLLPMSGLVNQPYTLVFRTEDEPSAFTSEQAVVQVEQAGYALDSRSGSICVITVPYLRRWNDESIERLRRSTQSGIRQEARVEPGHYQVRVVGGVVNGDATFEFVLRPVSRDRSSVHAAAETTFVIG